MSLYLVNGISRYSFLWKFSIVWLWKFF